MTERQEKIKEFLVINHFSLWGTTREKCWDKVSDKHRVICACGKLCTGLHENSCSKFQDEVDRETLKELKPFIDGLGIFKIKRGKAK